jgi:hypothetical protein
MAVLTRGRYALHAYERDSRHREHGSAALPAGSTAPLARIGSFSRGRCSPSPRRRRSSRPRVLRGLREHGPGRPAAAPRSRGEVAAGGRASTLARPADLFLRHRGGPRIKEVKGHMGERPRGSARSSIPRSPRAHRVCRAASTATVRDPGVAAGPAAARVATARAAPREGRSRRSVQRLERQPGHRRYASPGFPSESERAKLAASATRAPPAEGLVDFVKDRG